VCRGVLKVERESDSGITFILSDAHCFTMVRLQVLDRAGVGLGMCRPGKEEVFRPMRLCASFWSLQETWPSRPHGRLRIAPRPKPQRFC